MASTDYLAPYAGLQLDSPLPLLTPTQEKKPIRTFSRLAKTIPTNNNTLLTTTNSASSSLLTPVTPMTPLTPLMPLTPVTPVTLLTPPTTAATSPSSAKSPARFFRSSPVTPVDTAPIDDFLGQLPVLSSLALDLPSPKPNVEKESQEQQQQQQQQQEQQEQQDQKKRQHSPTLLHSSLFTAHQRLDRHTIDLDSPLFHPSDADASTVAKHSSHSPLTLTITPVPSPASASAPVPITVAIAPPSPLSPAPSTTTVLKPTFTRITKPHSFNAINTTASALHINDRTRLDDLSSTNTTPSSSIGYSGFHKASPNPLLTPSSSTSSLCPSLVFSRSSSNDSLLTPLSAPIKSMEAHGCLSELPLAPLSDLSMSSTMSTTMTSTSPSPSVVSPTLSASTLSPTTTSVCSESSLSSSPPSQFSLMSLDYDWWQESNQDSTSVTMAVMTSEQKSPLSLSTPPLSENVMNSAASPRPPHHFYSLNSARKCAAEVCADKRDLALVDTDMSDIHEQARRDTLDPLGDNAMHASTPKGQVSDSLQVETLKGTQPIGYSKVATTAAAAAAAATTTATTATATHLPRPYCAHGEFDLCLCSEEEGSASEHSTDPEDGMHSSSSCSSSPPRQGFYKVRPKSNFHRARFPSPPPALTGISTTTYKDLDSASVSTGTGFGSCEASPQDFLGEADLPYPLPSTLQERQARQRKRAEQLKQLKIREEREARENGRRIRRRGASFSAGVSLATSPSVPTTTRPASMTLGMRASQSQSQSTHTHPSLSFSLPWNLGLDLDSTGNGKPGIQRSPSSPARTGGLCSGTGSGQTRKKNCVGFDLRRTKIFEYDASEEVDKALSSSGSSGDEGVGEEEGEDEDEDEEDAPPSRFGYIRATSMPRHVNCIDEEDD
ncbi:hypothetical protein BGZ94_003387 [Podila epigama]|nr:hypothetical protein BGZ94_003387 [Podila epigama]